MFKVLKVSPTYSPPVKVAGPLRLNTPLESICPVALTLTAPVPVE
jgi:hypothetical protein